MVASSAGGVSSLGQADMDLAIALFERGFPEARVQEALRHCSSLDEAVGWLTTGDSKARAEGSKAPPAHIVSAPTASRRRAVRKVCDTSAAAPPSVEAHPAPASVTAESTSAGSAVSLSPLVTTASATGGAEVASPAAASAATRRTELEESPGTGRNPRLALPIPPRDATGWWQQAAARFVRAAADAIESSPSAHAATPKRKREASSEPREGGGDGAAHADEAACGESRPSEDADSKRARRPPATPCSSKAASEPGSGPEASGAASAEEKETLCSLCSPAPSSKVQNPATPRSSPRAMRLNSRTEMCEICCNDVPPWRAVRLGCSHGWYCAQCMLRHAEARLATGAASIACPECCTPLAERDLRKLLPQEIIDRLLARSLEQAVSSAADLHACPTPNCPMRVALEDGEIPRLRCTFCKKTSCLKCGAQPYHKGLTCQENKERLRTGGARGKSRKQQEEEESLQRWIEETGTKQCPTCRIAVSKQNIKNQHTQYSECHKMCCRNCNTRFCFKCLAVLSDNFTCGCTIDAHGFIDPRTGKRLNHLRRGGRGKVAAKRASTR